MKSFRLGPWKVRPEISAVINGDEVRIEPQVMEVLCRLARRPGAVVSKEELIEDVWAGRFVGEEVITNAVWELRRALGDNARKPTFIQTIPKKGYRLIAPVKPLGEESAEEDAGLRNTDQESRSAGSGEGGIPESRNACEVSQAEERGRRAGSWIAPLKAHPLSLAAAAGAVLVALALFVFPGVFMPSDADSPPLTIAVLPFQELAGDEYFAQGLSDALAGELARFPHFRVVARTSSRSAAGDQVSLEEIARRLGAQALIQGTVQRQASQVRLTLQLTDSQSGSFFWSQPFEQEDSRLPLLILRAAQEAAGQLAEHYPDVPRPSSQLADEIEAMERRAAVGRQAYEDYLRGVHFWKSRTRGGLFRAVQYFEKAIRQAPEYASAYAGLANAHIILADHFYAPSQPSLEKAHQAAQKALELDPENPQALTAMAWILWVRDWNWGSAEELFRRALRHNPSYSTGHQWFASLLEVAGRTDEAQFHATEAQRLDVLSPIVHITAGTVALRSGRPDAARHSFEKALQLDPHFVEAHKGLFWDALDRGDMDLAFTHCAFVQQHVLEHDDWRPYLLRFQLEDACQPKRIRRVGLREDEFRTLQAHLKGRQERGLFVSPFLWLELYAAAGRTEEASEWLRGAIQARGRHLFYLPQHLQHREEINILKDPLLASQLEHILMPQPRD
ncbi:MAG TPA: winged helix-turn-helix domain-containing protein [Acidobacteriota bacterium]|nr:winged helix-turn-helix domain-containing protein [Acidobacteriota bacterium]